MSDAAARNTSCRRDRLFSGVSYPSRAFVRGYPCTLCRQPPPRPRLRRDIHTLLRHPPPRPRLRRSSPAPSRGRGQCVAISGEQPYPGCSRWEIVSGVELVGNRIRGGAGGPPCPALLRDLPMCWTVVISPRGVGPTGRGNSFPLPCLSRSNHLASRRSHPSLWQGTRILRRPPPPRPRIAGSEPGGAISPASATSPRSSCR